MDALVNRLSTLVFGGVAQRIPQRIRQQQRIDHRLSVRIVGVGCYFSVADIIDYMAEEGVLRNEIFSWLYPRRETQRPGTTSVLGEETRSSPLLAFRGGTPGMPWEMIQPFSGS
jgi:hypothetical protein